MNWTYQGNEITSLPEDVVGFVYQITNMTNGRMYIGKKLARFKRSRPPLKGRKNKRRYKVDSDWQDYYGSSDELTADVLKLGKEKFTREILFYCHSKAELSYVEAREQFARKVLESNDYMDCPVCSNRGKCFKFRKCDHFVCKICFPRLHDCPMCSKA